MPHSLDTYSQFFKALSEPLRIRLLHLLAQRESLCVCDLVSVLETGQSTVSRHLAYLKKAHLIDSYRQGAWMHYRLLPQALTPLNETVFNELCQQLPETQSDLAKLVAYEPCKNNTLDPAFNHCGVCQTDDAR